MTREQELHAALVRIMDLTRDVTADNAEMIVEQVGEIAARVVYGSLGPKKDWREE